jgi:hypothetical protein
MNDLTESKLLIKSEEDLCDFLPDTQNIRILFPRIRRTLQKICIACEIDAYRSGRDWEEKFLPTSVFSGT